MRFLTLSQNPFHVTITRKKFTVRQIRYLFINKFISGERESAIALFVNHCRF